MLTVLDDNARLCDGVTRREWLQVGSLGAFGMTLQGLLAAREAYRVPETGLGLKPGEKLTDAYLKANLPAVRRRLYQAGVRLAIVLNEAFHS